MVQRNHTIGDPQGTYWERSVQSGDDTPVHLRKRGLWPINRYHLERESQQQAFTLAVDAQGNALNGTMYPTNSFAQISVDTVVWPQEADVINKLGEKWRGTDLNLAMYLSPEGRESLQMMTTGLMKISNGARSLKRGDFGGFLRNMNELPRHARKRSARKFEQGDLSGSFLAAHLGWEPLIKDVYSASQGIADLPESVHRITARKLGYRPIYGLNLRDGMTIDISSKVQVRLTVDMRRPPTFSQQFGMDNPFLIAWELVPLSFVADYFLPIGDVISAMGTISAMYGRENKGFRKAYEAYDVSLTVPRGTRAFTAWWVDYFTKSEIRTRKTHRTFDRTLWTPSFTDPLRSMRVSLPDGIMKLSTLASLTHQRILSLGSKRK